MRQRPELDIGDARGHAELAVEILTAFSIGNESLLDEILASLNESDLRFAVVTLAAWFSASERNRYGDGWLSEIAIFVATSY